MEYNIPPTVCIRFFPPTTPLKFEPLLVCLLSIHLGANFRREFSLFFFKFGLFYDITHLEMAPGLEVVLG